MTFSLLLAAATLTLFRGDDGHPPPAKTAPEPPAVMKKLDRLVGGVWTSPGAGDGQAKELRFERIMGGRVIRGTGVLGIGSKNPTEVMSLIGWEPGSGEVYYLDLHGPHAVFKGTARLEGEKVIFDFNVAVGKPAQFRTEEEFPDADTYRFAIFAKEGAGWKKMHEETMKRRKD